MSKAWSSMPALCPKVASTPMAWVASGTAAIAVRKEGSKSRPWLDLTGNCAYCLSVEQTPASVDACDP
jgi:hypothetical protein